MTTTPDDTRRRVAVLGGGAGSMGALWALTSLPDAAERFDITVYQMGWRLGGKGCWPADVPPNTRTYNTSEYKPFFNGAISEPSPT